MTLVWAGRWVKKKRDRAVSLGAEAEKWRRRRKLKKQERDSSYPRLFASTCSLPVVFAPFALRSQLHQHLVSIFHNSPSERELTRSCAENSSSTPLRQEGRKTFLQCRKLSESVRVVNGGHAKLAKKTRRKPSANMLRGLRGAKIQSANSTRRAAGNTVAQPQFSGEAACFSGGPRSPVKLHVWLL